MCTLGKAVYGWRAPIVLNPPAGYMWEEEYKEVLGKGTWRHSMYL